MSENLLIKFSEAVINEANEEKKKYIQELKEEEDKTLNKEKEALEVWLNNYVQVEKAKLDNKKVITVSKKKSEQKRELIFQRTEMFNQVFNEVGNNVSKFINSDAYERYITKTFSEAMKDFDSGVTVCTVNSRDVKIFEKLISGMVNIEIECTEAILGGFTLKNDELHLGLDGTVDSKIEEQREKFFATSGLVIE